MVVAGSMPKPGQAGGEKKQPFTRHAVLHMLLRLWPALPRWQGLSDTHHCQRVIVNGHDDVGQATPTCSFWSAQRLLCCTGRTSKHCITAGRHQSEVRVQAKAFGKLEGVPQARLYETAHPRWREATQRDPASLDQVQVRCNRRSNRPGMYQAKPHQVALQGHWLAEMMMRVTSRLTMQKLAM